MGHHDHVHATVAQVRTELGDMGSDAAGTAAEQHDDLHRALLRSLASHQPGRLTITDPDRDGAQRHHGDRDQHGHGGTSRKALGMQTSGDATTRGGREHPGAKRHRRAATKALERLRTPGTTNCDEESDGGDRHTKGAGKAQRLQRVSRSSIIVEHDQRHDGGDQPAESDHSPGDGRAALDVQSAGEQRRQAEADQSRREGTQSAGQGRQCLLSGGTVPAGVQGAEERTGGPGYGEENSGAGAGGDGDGPRRRGQRRLRALHRRPIWAPRHRRLF